MKALALLVACLALAITTPSRAGMMGGPHHSAPHPRTQPAHGSSSHFHHGQNDGAGLGFPQEMLDFTPGINVPSVVDPAVVNPEVEPVFLPPAQRCPAGEPVVVRSSGPHILYIDQKPPVQANLPKVIYGTD
jgi:hypothetical protein